MHVLHSSGLDAIVGEGRAFREERAICPVEKGSEEGDVIQG